MNSTVKLAISIAISWAWAGSLLVGPSLLKNQGIESFLLWGIANCSTLALFGQLYKRQIVTDKILENKYILTSMLGIQLLCLLVQLMGIYTCFNQFFTPQQSYIATVIIGIIFIVGMYWKGLEASIHTDMYQGIFAILGLLAIAGWILIADVPSIDLKHSEPRDLIFGSWTACILLSGIITDLQHWQRAKKNQQGYAFELATGFFAIYIALIGYMAMHMNDDVIAVILLFVMLCATTSTIDSIAVALHKLFNKTVGTCTGIFVCTFFSVFTSLGFVQLWANLGIFRVSLALVILAIGIYQFRK